MKKFVLLLFLMLCCATFSYAQQVVSISDVPEGKYRVYCELLGINKNLFSTKLKVVADLGQQRSYWKNGDEMLIVNEQGKQVIFNSMIDAMNYFGKYGWKFVQAYAVTMGAQNVYHWLLYKDVTNEEEVKEGIITKADLKK